jgi:hypothetical protein
MNLLESEDWGASDSVELTDAEKGGALVVHAVCSFVELKEPAAYEDQDPKYSASFKIPKGHEDAAKVIAVCDLVGRKVWKNDADEKLETVWGGLDQGVLPRMACVGIQDGDKYQSEYNAGTWYLKASRRDSDGRPTIVDADGNHVYEPNDIDKETEELVLGELIDTDDFVPKQGDLVRVAFSVWAQGKRDRINFTLEGIQFVKRGAANRRAIEGQSRTAAMLGGGDTNPRIAAKATPKKKAAAKKPAKKKAAKGGAFRKNRK